MAAQEETLFAGRNLTFHRSAKQEVEFTVTKQHLSYRYGNAQFKRIELKDILNIRLAPLPTRSMFFKISAFLLSILPLGVAFIVQKVGNPISLKAWLTILFVSAALAVAFLLDVLANSMRHTFIIQTRSKTFTIKSPPDSYVEEQIKDLEFFRNVLSACRNGGVQIFDESKQ